ncbi:MAG: SWIM zinc finger family protein [Bacteroidia bacterium]|nr:SWIM zinc finger family protein [Bacteroidia bacterium]
MQKIITMSYWYYNYNYRKARRPKKTSTTPVQRKKFGQTFWGQHWLNSLKGIDYSNRLPRGSAYANNGSVLSHEISGNKISAKVQGSMPKPYNVTVEVPVFTQSEKEKLTGILTSNPAWLAGLLNRQLPQELLAEAQKYNIKIFPSAWSDFKMNCSCPDWAVPCKHLAAVIYILSSEIDLNPMLVLNLHELDILAELKKKKIDVSKDIQEELPSLSSGVKFQKKNLLPEADKSRQSAVGSPQSAVHTQEINFSDLDYSHLPETGASLLNLLSEETPFYHKNAKNELLSFFNSVKRDIKRVHSDISDLKAEHLRTCIDARIYIPRKEIRPHIKLVFENEIKNYDLGELSAWMLKIDLPDTLNWCYPMKTMYEMINFSSRLISSGNTIPQLVTHNNTARFIWFPLIQNQTVKQILDKFNMAFPSHALLFEGEKPEETGFPEITNSGLICALFITSFIRVMNEDEHKKGKSDVLLSAFSGFDSELLSDSSVANAMQLWLKKLHVAKSRFTPVLQVEDKYPEFRVSLLIDDKERTDTPPVIFKNFSEDKRYQDEKMGVLKNLMLLGNHFKQLSELVNNTKKKYLSYSTNEFTTLLFGMLPVMKLLGVEVLLPKNMAKVTAPKLSLMIKNKSGEKPRSFLDLYEMLGFDWQIAVGDMLMDKEEFFKLLGNFTGLVKLKDRFVMLSPEELEKLKKQLSNPPHPDHNDTVRALLSEDYDGAPLGIDPKLTKLIKQWTGPGKESLPEELNATLRPYQVRGYEWLYKNSKLGIGSILADDMGLGKTLQAIAFMLKLKQNGELQKKKALVIAPTTLLTNWAREIDKFTGSLSHFIYHGQKRNSDEFSGYDVILTSYGMLRSDLASMTVRSWNRSGKLRLLLSCGGLKVISQLFPIFPIKLKTM